MLHTRKSYKSGPIANDNGIPYDYIVIIDAGSKGSRVFVYSWLNPGAALENGFDLNEHMHFKDFKLVKRVDVPGDSLAPGDETREDLASPSLEADSLAPGSLDDNDSDSEPEDNHGTIPIKLPKIISKKKWKNKVKPGISTFNNSPQKVGNHHLKYLLTTAGRIVPKSQHYRTPIFLHSTAGMRLLTPPKQQKILNNVCKYFKSQSDFFLPDCASHINVIEGDIEGIYGWLAINYLVGSFDNPSDHQHGKNHTTYGLLDMGGASTQVVFQPNLTEIDEHENNLYSINLFELPVMDKDGKRDQKDAADIYSSPIPLNYKVYSDSFLGLGLSQAYNKYLGSLIEKNSDDTAFFYYPPINDPCLPKGYRAESSVNGVSRDFTGNSDFENCLKSVFPVISQSSYGTASRVSGNCKQYNEGEKVSSCLLNDLIPAFDFDINHFYGVSGYWYAISNLMAYNEPVESTRDTIQSRDKDSNSKDADYDYKIIYENTQKLCSKSYGELIELNKLKPEKDQLSMEELTNLCFKSSWILNFLHLGLGFPRFGIDDVDQAQKDKFKSLQMVDKINGAEFSWTLGRALLYSNDEYIQAFHNYTLDKSNGKRDEVERAGFKFSVIPNAFHYGSEQPGILSRPKFTPVDPEAKYQYFDYETEDLKYTELKWYIEPHRWYGIVIFACLLSFILWLLLGKQGRLKLTTWGKDIFNKSRELLVKSTTKRNNYTRVPDLEARGLGEHDVELNELESERHDGQTEI